MNMNLMIRNLETVVENVGSELATYLREAHHGGGAIEQIFARAEAMKRSARNVTGASADMGYLTLFMYEVMHESVTMRFRADIDGDDPAKIRQSPRAVLAKHQQTLIRLVSDWKPGTEKSTVTAMKVTSLDSVHELILDRT